MNRVQARAGFTLLEVLLVLAIIIIIMAVAFPSLEAWYGDTRVQAAADDVRGAWAEARARAIDTGVTYRFSVKNSDTFRIAPDVEEYWEGATDDGETESDDGKVLVGKLPKNIHFRMDSNAPMSSSGWITVARFLPDGTCKDDAQIVLDADGYKPLVVSVRSLTGITRVQPQKQLEESEP
jgi:prepilin-type N-terminal cleavage/methylation domain-containing protein